MRLTGNSMKRGSALLIVLGMLSFMVVSAVSFAIYMRQSRAPSSYLRRNLAARYLVRAALAKAIDQLEGDFESSWGVNRMYGVYDDPYPGCSTASGTVLEDGNFWMGRVFTPFGFVDPDNTVATLTLEGLAYLPPPIANDVRAISRCTRTAMWRSLPYEAGRYAYTAVNVSDCLDVNKVAITANRDSSAGGRLSLYSLFDDSGVANGVEDVVDKAMNDDKPLVSLADFALLASSKYSPFQSYIGEQGASFGEQGDNFTENAYFMTDTYCPLTNRVDGTGSKRARFGLAEEQPWKLPFSMSHWSMCWEEANSQGDASLGKFLAGRLGGVGMACLYDYLDEDSIPVSLSIPTTEVTPMVVGLGSTLLNSGTLMPKVSKGEEYETGHAATGEVVGEGEDAKKKWRKRKITQYALSLTGSAMANGIVVFPFKRTISATSRQPATTTGQVLTRVYLAEASTNPKCRVANASPLYPEENLWSQQRSYADGIFTVRNEIQDGLSFGEVKKMSEAVKLFTSSETDLPNDTVPFFYQVEEYEGLGKTEADIVWNTTPTKTYKSLDGLKDKWVKFYGEDGEVSKTWTALNGKAAAEMPDKKDATPSADGPQEATFGTVKLEFNIAMWAKLSQGGKAVDLCPAKTLDDKVWLQKEADLCSNDGDAVRASGSGTPLLNFHADSLQFELSEMQDKLNGSTPADCSQWKFLVAVDPRFNWAPEDWVGYADSSMSAADWLAFIGADKSGSPVFGWGNGRDTDIFMFVSNQEYLQSIGELAFLPAVQPNIGARSVSELGSSLTTPWDGEIAKNSDYDGEGFNSRIFAKGAMTSAEITSKLANGWCMWKTYSAFDPDLSDNPNGTGQDHDYIYQLGDQNRGFVEILPETSNAFRLTPFADEKILMAAFKDTPYDYYIASTNTRVNWKSTSASARLEHVFASDSSYAKMTDKTFENIVGDFYDLMHKREYLEKIASGNWAWQRIYDTLPWYEEANKTSEEDMKIFFDESQSEPLHGVDRKFLYSFWRECFDNRQQLYLIFVRAEPAAVGGGGSGEFTTSQLGGRAVALVWRDPNPPSYNAAQRKKRSEMTSLVSCRENFEAVPPHRTRVLFYHVFE